MSSRVYEWIEKNKERLVIEFLKEHEDEFNQFCNRAYDERLSE